MSDFCKHGYIGGCRECIGQMPDGKAIEDALRAEIAKYRGMEVEDAALRNDNEALRAEVEVRGDQVSALMEQVAHYMAEAQELRAELHQVRMNWDAALKAKLAKYTVPLTDNHVASLADDWALPSHEFKLIDAAIRRARRGE